MTNMQVFVMAAVVALSFGSGGVMAASPSPFQPPMLTGVDKSTIQKLHDGDQLAIQMGKLAQDKGSTRAARAYGQRLVADNTLAERKIDAYLRKRGADLSALASTTNADPDHELLATKSGVEFDRAFARQIVSDHQKSLDLIESARVETGDDALGVLYDDLTTTLRADQRAAKDLLAASARS
jgi:predicted outer membrane protein